MTVIDKIKNTVLYLVFVICLADRIFVFDVVYLSIRLVVNRLG